MRAVLYCRVSKEEGSQQAQDPMNQLIPLRNYAKAMDYTIVKEYIEYASGGNSNRPVFKSMLAKARQRHFDIVLVWALDRFSREGMSQTFGYIQQLEHCKVGLKSLQETWLDTSDPAISHLLVAIFSWVAQQERLRISDRTKAALAKLKKNGVKLGRPRKKPTP